MCADNSTNTKKYIYLGIYLYIFGNAKKMLMQRKLLFQQKMYGQTNMRQSFLRQLKNIVSKIMLAYTLPWPLTLLVNLFCLTQNYLLPGFSLLTFIWVNLKKFLFGWGSKGLGWGIGWHALRTLQLIA